MRPLDRLWLSAHPLPKHADGSDKNDRGRVLIVGGSELVPGALRLTAEAALRAGAGKVRMATIASAALPLGIFVPEAATMALPSDETGEIAVEAAPLLIEAIERCDCLVLGPGMADADRATGLVERVLARPHEALSVLLDAAAVACAGRIGNVLGRHGGRAVVTPHHGEMAALTGRSIDEIAADPEGIACATARSLNAVVVLKAGTTIVAAPDAEPLLYPGGGIGLATGGSGDVLAGVIGGLLSRGAARGVWLHGEAGRTLMLRSGALGLLARELPGEIPPLMNSL